MGWNDDHEEEVTVAPGELFRVEHLGTFGTTHRISGRRAKLIGGVAQNAKGQKATFVLYSEDVDVIRTLQMEIDEEGLTAREEDPQ